MQYQNVELFNTEEVVPFEGGVILARFPEEARADMKSRASWMAYASIGCEVRFVCEAEIFWITLGAAAQNVDVYVMLGDYTLDKFTIPAGQKKTIQYEKKDVLAGMDPEVMEPFDERFSHLVWRFYFNSEGAGVFYSCRALNGTLRPPYEKELPTKTMLAYGSSITHGCWAIDTRNSYIQQVARRLNLDVLNKGMAGACRLEDSTMEYLIAQDSWDLAFLELGVNVLNSYSVEEFRKRAEHLAVGMCKKKPNNPVYLTFCYYGRGNYTQKSDQSEHAKRSVEYEKVLSGIREKFGLSNLYYIEGTKIMDSGSYLCYDMVHPSDYGHIRMGENLARIITESGAAF